MSLQRFRVNLFSALALMVWAGLSAAQAPSAAEFNAIEKYLMSDRFTIVAPFPPGGPVDLLARLLAEGFAKKYKQIGTVENLAGGAGNIGMERIKRAKPGGHQLLLIPAGNLTVNPSLMANFPFVVERDFVAVSMLAKAPNVLVTHPGLKVRSAKELVALAKAKPGQLAFASPGIGSGLHLAGELFKLQTQTDLVHVPYKGTVPALNDLIGEQVALMFSNLPGALPHIRSGKLVALGITDAVRTGTAPEIPTLAEQGVDGVVVVSWYGLMAPAGTTPAQADQLARDAAEFLSRPAVRDQMMAQGLVDVLMKPSDFANHIARETASWAKIIKARQIEVQ